MSLLVGLTTDDLLEGSNKYFTVDRAKAATVSLFSAICPLTGNPDSNVLFTYDPGLGIMTANVALPAPGMLHLSHDTHPTLGGDLNLDQHAISGIGTINIHGRIGASDLTINNQITANDVRVNNDLVATNIQLTELLKSKDVIVQNSLTTSNLTVLDQIHGDIKLPGTADINRLKINTIVDDVNVTGTVSAKFLAGTVVGTDISTYTVDTCETVVKLGTLDQPVTVYSHSTDTHAIFTGLTNTKEINTAVYIRQSRGTLDAPEAVEPGDLVMRINAQGHTGTDYQTVALFGARIDSTGQIKDGRLPGEFVMGVYDTDANIKFATFNSRGTMSAPVVQVGVHTESMYPEFPTKGMILFDDTTNRFVGYNGTKWVPLSE
jgi:hypothetical protein